MHQNSQSNQPEVLDNGTLETTEQFQSDVLVLRYMVQRIQAQLLNLVPNAILPSMDYIEEQHGGIHRIIIYKQQDLLLKERLIFVGFISGIQDQISTTVIQELHRIDQILIAELAEHPGILSYSSLELRKGHWYNLVLLSDYAAKTYFKTNSLHRYAAYQLATHYYAWIRLHNGVMPGGLLCHEMVVQSTKYYTFPEVGRQPLMREQRYEMGALMHYLFGQKEEL